MQCGDRAVREYGERLGVGMKPSGIGGQAVLEGVMMKNEEIYAVAVRKPDKQIVVEKKEFHGAAKKYPFLGWLFIRGVVSFVESMVLGMKTLTFSASFYEEEDQTEPSEFEKKLIAMMGEKAEAVMMGCTVAVSVLLAVAIFMLLPFWIASLLEKVVTSSAVLTLVEGLIRITIFIGYVLAISMMKDIRRVFMYHGAEHKSINCIEHGMPLTVENVKQQSTRHKRCGTSFMLFVIILSALFFMFIRVDNMWLRMLFRVLLIPVIAGVSYEFIKLAGRSENRVVELLSKPGLWLQGLTTREPDEEMIEVAIRSVEAVFDWHAFLEEDTVPEKKTKAAEKPETEQKEVIDKNEVIDREIQLEETREEAAYKEVQSEAEEGEAILKETQPEEATQKPKEKKTGWKQETAELQAVEKTEAVQREQAVRKEIAAAREDSNRPPKKSVTRPAGERTNAGKAPTASTPKQEEENVTVKANTAVKVTAAKRPAARPAGAGGTATEARPSRTSRPTASRPVPARTIAAGTEPAEAEKASERPVPGKRPAADVSQKSAVSQPTAGARERTEARRPIAAGTTMESAAGEVKKPRPMSVRTTSVGAGREQTERPVKRQAKREEELLKEQIEEKKGNLVKRARPEPTTKRNTAAKPSMMKQIEEEDDEILNALDHFFVYKKEETQKESADTTGRKDQAGAGRL